MTEPAKKYRVVCRECGSDDVLADAYASWDVESQRWEAEDVFDKGSHCNACDGECRLEWVEIE